MSCFSSIHHALQNSQVGKAVNEVKKHPVATASAAKYALALA